MEEYENDYDGDGDDDDGDRRRFPVDKVIESISPVISKHFGLKMSSLHLSDMFVVSYNTKQSDTTCGKHKDPSDVTVNVCLECEGVQGSEVVFYGSRRLEGVHDYEDASEDDKFKVESVVGCCTMHYGDHCHEVEEIFMGERTNVVMTFVKRDGSEAEKVDCYE